jgi:branched-chain amino acid transport system substrate-binding protein
LVQAFRERFPKPADDYLHLRMQMMVQALVQSIEKTGTTDAIAVALQLEKAQISMAGQTAFMRASDHQFQQTLVVGQMARQGEAGVKFDVEGSGFGFKVIRRIPAEQAALPTTCQMLRPS